LCLAHRQPSALEPPPVESVLPLLVEAARTHDQTALQVATGDQPLSHKTHGTFAELRPRTRLVLGHVIDFLPGVKPYDSAIVAEFFPFGDRVRMVVTLHRMHDDEFTRMQIEGFTSQLTKLDKRFGA
jgi:hypothetical protein